MKQSVIVKPGPTAVRALKQYVENLNVQMRLLPLTSPLRGPLIGEIRKIEGRIAAMEGL